MYRKISENYETKTNQNYEKHDFFLNYVLCAMHDAVCATNK